jgi:hypothetical protein
VDRIVKQAGPPQKPAADGAKAATLKQIILEEIPLQMPVAEARAILERHGFSCWANVPDDHGLCLHCTAYKRTGMACADRVVVKVFAEEQRVSNVEVTVEQDVWQVYATPYAPGPGSGHGDEKGSGGLPAAGKAP